MTGKETRESWTPKPGSSRAQRWHEFAGHEAASEEGGRVSSGSRGRVFVLSGTALLLDARSLGIFTTVGKVGDPEN